MMPLLASMASALWLGVLTSISPCPLASNIAAVSYVGRQVGHPRRVLAAGLLYSLGRALTYVVVGSVVVSGMLSIPSLSFFLQSRMNQILGPLLALIGSVLLLRPRLPFAGWRASAGAQRRVAGTGVFGAGLLGMLFALSFCPVSAGLFFGALIPLAVSHESRFVLPSLYGIGTGLPVVGVGCVLAFGAQWTGQAFDRLARIERIARLATALVFIAAGAYISYTHLVAPHVSG